MWKAVSTAYFKLILTTVLLHIMSRQELESYKALNYLTKPYTQGRKACMFEIVNPTYLPCRLTVRRLIVLTCLAAIYIVFSVCLFFVVVVVFIGRGAFL